MRKIVSIVLSVLMVAAMSAMLIPAAGAAGGSAAIGSTEYAGLAEAIVAVKAGETIKITADYTTDVAIDYAPETAISFKIDGQGHKITANVSRNGGDTGFLKIGNATVEISNLKIDYTEASKSVNNGTMGCDALSVADKGDVTLVNCDFVSFYGDCLFVNSGGKLTIKSGSYIIDPSNTKAECPQSNLICTNGAATVVVDGGKFERVGGEYKRAIFRLNGGPSDITINGGEFKCTIGRILNLNGGFTPESDGKNRKAVINGGTFECGDDTGSYDPVININAKGFEVVINGGTFTTTAACKMFPDNYSSKDYVSVVINGGKFTGTEADVTAVQAAVPEGTVTKVEGTTITVGNPAPVVPAANTGDNSVIIFAAAAAVALVLSIGAVAVSRKEN